LLVFVNFQYAQVNRAHFEPSTLAVWQTRLRLGYTVRVRWEEL